VKQENVWEYPRPPRLEPVDEVLSVVFGGVEIARTSCGWRVLETSHAPTYYLPPEDVAMTALVPARGRATVCEWKGRAEYWTVSSRGARAERAAWSFPAPTPRFAAIAGHIAFYAGRMDVCRVGDVTVLPQDGDFYGGWVTPNLIGPIKGARGTEGW
jgi:uncharacterized protein (DUF427 family)